MTIAFLAMPSGVALLVIVSFTAAWLVPCYWILNFLRNIHAFVFRVDFVQGFSQLLLRPFSEQLLLSLCYSRSLRSGLWHIRHYTAFYTAVPGLPWLWSTQTLVTKHLIQYALLYQVQVQVLHKVFNGVMHYTAISILGAYLKTLNCVVVRLAHENCLYMAVGSSVCSFA